MTVTVQFFGWWRPSAAGLVTSPQLADGRLQASVTLTAQDAANASDSAARTLGYHLVGPGDVTGLSAGAVVGTYPARGGSNAEVDKAVYAELVAPDLPWRYVSELPQGGALRPWLALLVGTTDEIVLQGSSVVVAPSVLADHPSGRGAVGAHVEQDPSAPGSAPIARLVSTRALEPDRDHRAVIVPAFGADGSPRWAAVPTEPLEVPVYFEWTFHTRSGGDFATLARRLRLFSAGPELGTASVRYEPLAEAPALVASGALVSASRPADVDPGPPTPAVSADLAAVTVRLGDAVHPVLGLPAYEDAWPDAAAAPLPPAEGWRAALHADPRARGIAGLGALAGVRHQDLLADAAARLAGAYEEAAERLRRLSLGVLTARSLWRRRMPVDGARRLSVVGPALRNVLAPTGPVVDALQRAGTAIGPDLFSTAAKRAWRSGGAAADDRHDLALRTATELPPAPARDDTPVAHTDGLAKVLQRAPLDDSVTKQPPPVSVLRDSVTKLSQAFDRTGFDPDTVKALDTRLQAVGQRIGSKQPTALLPLLQLLDASTAARPTREDVRRLVAGLDQAPDSDDLAALGLRLTRRPPAPALDPVDLDAAATLIAAAFDPTVARPAIVDRVASGIDGLDGDPLVPQELLPDLPLAAWQFLRDDAPDWLLPGAGELPTDSVVALTTNPAFVDGFLVGLNAQVLGELRFRNLPVLPGWTPLRTFWERTNPASGATDDDIEPIGAWPAASPFGADELQSPSASSADLVVLFNTALFREYPGTLVYLVPAPPRPDGTPDWAAEPMFTSPLFPSFQGQLAAEQVFFGFDLDPDLVAGRWVVLEETVRGRRFWNTVNADHRTGIAAAPDGAELAQAAVVEPRRVMIRGDVLLRKPS